MILEVYGKGSLVPVGYVRAFLKDGRLSREEDGRRGCAGVYD